MKERIGQAKVGNQKEDDREYVSSLAGSASDPKISDIGESSPGGA